MSARFLLRVTSVVAACIGGLAVSLPGSLLEGKGVAAIDPAAIAMTRTVGVALLGVAALDAACRDLPSSTTLRRVLAANAALQLALLPLDLIAYATGAFHGLGSFVPNTALHLALAVAFIRAWLRERDA